MNKWIFLEISYHLLLIDFRQLPYILVSEVCSSNFGELGGQHLKHTVEEGSFVDNQHVYNRMNIYIVDV